MDDKITYATGVWCTRCNYFEDEDLDGDCPACGCPESTHREAVVVEA